MPESIRYSLKALIKEEGLALVGPIIDKFESLFLKIKIIGNKIIFIGVDGPTSSGKTVLSQKMKNFLLSKNIDSEIISFDWFLNSRKVRTMAIQGIQTGKISFEDYSLLGCDLDRFYILLNDLKKYFISDSRTLFKKYMPNIYNRRTGRCDQIIKLNINPNSIIIIEGGGILSNKFYSIYDLSIRLDIDNRDLVLSRLIQRQLEKPINNRLPIQFLKERFNKLDFPYNNYLRFRDRKNFDYLVDTTNFSKSKLYSRINSPKGIQVCVQYGHPKQHMLGKR